MGNCECRDSSGVAPSKNVTILMLGLDNSGKTTLLANLNGESTEGITPTIGFSSTNLEMSDYHVTLYDLGGSSRLRNIWKNYYSECYGSVFVVDASDLNRFTEAKETLSDLTQHERMRGKPLLIFANKQDCKDAFNRDQIGEALDLNGVLGEHRNLSRVVQCVGLKSTNGNKSVPSIKQGIQWLLNQMSQHYDQAQERVNADVAVQRAMEAQKRRERAERVRKIKEERERQKKLAGMADEEEEIVEPDGGEMSDPFKPIMQTALETEAREKTIKVQNEEIQERLRAMQDKDSRVSVGEDTGPLPSGENSKSEQCELAEGEPDHGRTELHGSQSTSGVSTSSDSLTDQVTPQSHASSESIQPPPPTLSQTENLPTHQPSQAQVDGKGKKKRNKRSMLIARLKNRRKIVPILLDSTNTAIGPSNNPQTYYTQRPLPVARNTWTAAELESVPDPSRSSTPISSIPSKTNIEGLPELPPRTKVILPPLRVTRQPVGITDKTFYTEEDIAAIPLVQLSQPPSLPPTVEQQ